MHCHDIKSNTVSLRLCCLILELRCQLIHNLKDALTNQRTVYSSDKTALMDAYTDLELHCLHMTCGKFHIEQVEG